MAVVHPVHPLDGTDDERLVDEAEQVESFSNLNELMVELRALGIKRVEVQL